MPIKTLGEVVVLRLEREKAHAYVRITLEGLAGYERETRTRNKKKPAIAAGTHIR